MPELVWHSRIVAASAAREGSSSVHLVYHKPLRNIFANSNIDNIFNFFNVEPLSFALCETLLLRNCLKIARGFSYHLGPYFFVFVCSHSYTNGHVCDDGLSHSPGGVVARSTLFSWSINRRPVTSVPSRLSAKLTKLTPMKRGSS